MTENAPYFRKPTSVTRVMGSVLLALIPAIATYVWLFGVGVLVSLVISSITALAAEAAVLKLRKRPVWPTLADGSALLTAWLTVLSMPPTLPWWLTVLAAIIAIILAKQLYGGLGQNPFNPAMVAFAMLIVAYPSYLSQWPSPHLSTAAQMQIIGGGERVLDAITAATPLDALRTGIKTGGQDVHTVMQGTAFGHWGGKNWEWIALAYLLGGLFLRWRSVITLHTPLAFLTAMTFIAGLCWAVDPIRFAPPLFHLFSGGTLLAAFFIVTDPVTGATTPNGKLIFGAGVGALTYLIRTFGNFPDGIAFGVLIMNMAAPLIDAYTQPKVFGHKQALMQKDTPK